MLNKPIIGDIYLKQIDPTEQSSEMGIHIVNDKYKGKGYCAKAEKMLLAYAYNKLNMKAVHADALINNERSMHALKKAGFIEVSSNGQAVYFECRKSTWNCMDFLDNYIVS